MNRLLLRTVVVGAVLAGAVPALADLVLPKDAPEAPIVQPMEPPIDVDAPVATPPVPPPPPVDEELMKELPPPAMGMGELIGPLAKTMLMLGVVLLIVYLTLHKGLGKLVERQNAGKRVKVVERVVLDQKRSLFLIELDGRQMLLAAGEGGVLHLKDVDPLSVSEPTTRGPSVGARFADALKAKLPGQPPVTTGLSRSIDERAAAMSDDATRKAT